MIPDINLLPNREGEEGSSKTIYIMLGIITALLLAVMSWMYFSSRSNVVSLTNQEQSLLAERDMVQTELNTLQGAGGSVKESLAFIEQISYPVTPLIEETKELLPENTYLRNYTFGESAVMISVDFETLNAVSTYISRLENSLYFLDVQVGAVSNFEIGPEGEKQERFKEVPRYKVEITLAINTAHLTGGGGE
jgi:hypothetical protein